MYLLNACPSMCSIEKRLIRYKYFLGFVLLTVLINLYFLYSLPYEASSSVTNKQVCTAIMFKCINKDQDD